MPGPVEVSASGHAAARWGVLLPTFDALRTGRPRDLISGARRAEELDFDAGWVGDHLVCHCPVLEATMALSAAAAVTERLTLGFSVLLLGLRAPELAANQIATIDALSGGRLVLGVGVGGEHPEEFEAAGVSVSERGKRLDATLSTLPSLLQGGEPYPAGGMPDNRESITGRLPRIVVGGRGDVALRRTAKFGDGWLPMWLSPDVLADRARRLHELAAAAGRPEPSVGLLVLVRVDRDLETARRAAAEHLAGQYKMPLRVVERWAALGPVERVAGQLRAYMDVGVTEFVLMPLGRDPLAQYERLAEVRDALAGGGPPSAWTPEADKTNVW
jgi:alkanesulfonate monooxygenase SsuD/methylene tetrahydromethanopterin reductase-like flavin-dependent oxidoreductase (luciferase family)